MNTYLAFDFGEKRVGVAVGNDGIKTGQALAVITYKNKEQLFLVIHDLLLEWQPAGLVVGLPLYPDGRPHDMTAKARRFANQLRGRFQLMVHEVDERYSSAVVQAGNDALAACVILEQFLNTDGLRL